MKWNEMNEMKWNEWNEMKWNEMTWMDRGIDGCMDGWIKRIE